MRVGIDKAAGDDLSPQVDIAVADFIVRLPLVHLGDAATLTVDPDGDIFDKFFLLWVEEKGRMDGNTFANHSDGVR